MRAINFMLAPDAFHPARFRLRGEDTFEVTAPAVQIDGRYHLLWRGVAEDRLSMTFADGAFDEVGAGFFVRP